MKTKRIVSLLSLVAIGAQVVGFSACGKPKDTEQMLEIYCTDAGYGVDWVYDTIELFKAQSWVKEKYPELKVLFTSNDDQTFASARLDAGAKSNTFDLLFGMNMWGYAGAGSNALDLTESVYNTTVPGEEIKYKDKMMDNYLISNSYVKGGEESYYTTSWASGMSAILYNEDLFKANGLKVPNTTNELINLCETYKKKGEDGDSHYSFIQSYDADYFNYLFPIWWAQYEGVQGYENFYNGIYNNTYSVRIFEQKGRQYALEVFADLLNYDKGYLNPDSKNQKFVIAQSMFLDGEALMHVNGDWFINEMKDVIERKGDEAPIIKTMPLPIISALGKKLGIEDAELSALVEYVDKLNAGETAVLPTFTSTTGYTQEEVVDAVMDARGIVHSVGANCHSVIPSYAKGKEAAVDFLRFMATDEALEAYMRTTDGSRLPFKYTPSQELYNSFSEAAQSRLDYLQGKNGTKTLISPMYFPLVRYGELKPFLYENYYQTFSLANNKQTPEDFMENCKDAWNERKFNAALAAAGLN